MGFWIIAGIVVCCVIAAIAKGAEEVEKEKGEKQFAAKAPDAFIRLFSEEFPDFAEGLTFTKAEAAIGMWNAALVSKENTKRFHWIRKGYYKNEQAKLEAETFIVTNLANEISPEFLKHAQDNPAETFLTVNRILTSTKTLAGQG